VRHAILHGTGAEVVALRYKDGLRAYTVEKPFEGVLPNLERRYRETDNPWVREDLSRYQAEKPCPACTGYRLKPESLAVKVAGRHIGEANDLSIRKRASGSAPSPTRSRRSAARSRAASCGRSRSACSSSWTWASTTSRSAAPPRPFGGESQRIRLASQIGSGLTGVLYVLDEPSIGLHQRDNERLLATLRRLRDIGNTVLVVEHDEDAIRSADHLIDIGPAAGKVAAGSSPRARPPRWSATRPASPASTCRARARIPMPEARRPLDPKRVVRVVGARGQQPEGRRAEIPLGTFTCIAGVSGGGKSTLVIETLFKAASPPPDGLGRGAGAA
jgi:excinuclease ABC subunit A